MQGGGCGGRGEKDFKEGEERIKGVLGYLLGGEGRLVE